MNLTEKQIGRQDLVDSLIFNLLNDLNPTDEIVEWEIEMIAEIRELISNLFSRKLKVFKEIDFYPFLNV